MSELNRALKEDLFQVACEMDLETRSNMKVVQLRELIKSSPLFEEEFVNGLVRNLIAAREERKREKQEELEERLRREALEEKMRQDELEVEKRKLEMNFELEKLKLQAQVSGQTVGGVSSTVGTSVLSESRIDVHKLLPTFNVETDDVTLFLVLLERQLKLSKVPENLWVSHLLSVIPSSISALIARESEENASSFPYVKNLLLKRFKVSAERFRQLFYSHRKRKEATWRDHYFELRAYFENWLKELNVNTFEALQDLFLADQLKQCVPVEVKEHLLDEWEALNSPGVLSERLDAYDSIRNAHGKKQLGIAARKEVGRQEPYKRDNRPENVAKAEMWGPSDRKQDRKPLVTCYGCGKPGFIRRRCPDCSGGGARTENVEVQQVSLYSCNTLSNAVPNVVVSICGKKMAVCADTGANRSIAGERLYALLKDSGVKFRSSSHEIVVADGFIHGRETLSAVVPVEVEGRVFRTEFIVLPKVKGNRTLLGMDFLRKARMVLNTHRNSWHFSDRPVIRYPFWAGTGKQSRPYVSFRRCFRPGGGVGLCAEPRSKFVSGRSPRFEPLLEVERKQVAPWRKRRQRKNVAVPSPGRVQEQRGSL